MIKIVIFPLVFYRDVVSHNDCTGLPRPYRSRLEKVSWTNFALQIFKEITSYVFWRRLIIPLFSEVENMSINPLWTRPVVHSMLSGNASLPPNASDLFTLRTAYSHSI